jgi:hypothetical protein
MDDSALTEGSAFGEKEFVLGEFDGFVEVADGNWKEEKMK